MSVFTAPEQMCQPKSMNFVRKMYVGTRIPSVEPHGLARGFSQKKDVLFLAGEEDPVANGLNKVIEKYKKSNANIKKNIIPRFRHDILHDSCKETVFRCIADFL